MMITAMGIGMRCLELAGNLLVFGLIFGYPLAEKRRWVAAGLIGLLAIMLPAMLPNWVPQVYITPILMYAVVFLLFERVRVGVIVAFDLAKSSLRAFCMSVITALLSLDAYQMADWYKGNFAANLMMLCIFVILAAWLYRYRKTAYHLIADVSRGYIAVMIGILLLPTITVHTTVEEDVLRVEGIRTAIDGLTGIFLCILFTLWYIVKQQKKELIQLSQLKDRCIEEQTLQYRLLNDKQQEMKKFRHDSKAHLGAIYALCCEAENERIKEYVSRLIEMEEEQKHFDAGNIIGDAVINQYYGLGLKENVEVKLAGKLAEEFAVPETDFCVILTNVISNAYEAAQRCAEQRFVEAVFTHYRGMQFITVRNTSPDCPEIKEGRIVHGYTSKGEKNLHGFGVQNICDAVERNRGSARWNCEANGNQYLVTAVIQIPLTE